MKVIYLILCAVEPESKLLSQIPTVRR